MKFFLYLALLLISLPSHGLHAAKLYAILVGDYFSEDIQQASKRDLQRMYNEVERIAYYGNFNLIVSVLAGHQAVGRELAKTLKELSPRKKDVIFFYFSGHGYRMSKSRKNPWPFLDFPSECLGMSFQDVIEHITALNARLAVLVADCCNWVLPENLYPPLLKGKVRGYTSEEREKKNYKKLFCKTKGVIAIAGAKPGQSSYCRHSGSFYTQSFLNSLHEVVQNSPSADWQLVVEYAEDYLQQLLTPHQLNHQQASFISFKIE